jgi:RimJ/RimL family protein N-acetyltransferase
MAGLKAIEGLVLRNNSRMLKLMEKLGFGVETSIDDPDMKLVTLKL